MASPDDLTTILLGNKPLGEGAESCTVMELVTSVFYVPFLDFCLIDEVMDDEEFS